ncbi:MAG: hypothetical protein KatS3mg068_1575 [Candidatus Sericytochromatia bacterium]|nr:MAG: hypothetical protein KatS3mg068_1575 [Candidatus Sericytochromatia bacterium]
MEEVKNVDKEINQAKDEDVKVEDRKENYSNVKGSGTSDKPEIDLLKNLDSLTELIDRYKKIESLFNNKDKESGKENKNSENVQGDISKNEIFELRKEIESLKNIIKDLAKYRSEDNSEEFTKKKEIVNKDKEVEKKVSFTKEDLDKMSSEELDNLKKELESLKEKGLGDLKSKIEELEDFKQRLNKERIEVLSLRRQELISKYGLEDLEHLIPDPIQNPNITEKDILNEVHKLLSNDIIKAGIELKKKNEVAKSKENYIDINKMSREELIKLRNNLLRNLS